MVDTFRQGRGTARIVFDGRSFVLPAASPYDLEMLLEHSRYLATRHGGAKIQMSGRTWLVQPPASAEPVSCHDCGKAEAVQFRCSGEALCQSCSSERMLEQRKAA